jgi:hypothetical protein
MPYHYPKHMEIADRLLPYRWQVTTKDEAASVVTQWCGPPDVLGEWLHAHAAEALYARRGMRE